ncbi:MAG TPA: hypothetical protein VNC50_07575, partial [Planctomycetia bacterium]|nr:hypothetical protein [Planctomycetia bacterium]
SCGRRWLVPATFILATGAAWLAAGQPLTAFADFLAASFEVARGYSEAMGVWKEEGQAVCFALPAIIFLILIPKGDRRSLALTLFAAASLFVWFKAGFVRAGADRSAEVFGLIAAALLWAAMTFARRKSLWLGLAALVVADSGIIGGEFQWRDVVHRRSETFGLPAWKAKAETLVAGRSARERRHAMALAHIANSAPEAPAPESVDSMPHQQAVVLAKGWRYRPRPVFQSYQAYTRDLAERNVRFIREQETARILFAVEPIDRRFPSLDDGASWPALFSHYRIERGLWPFVFLERREWPRSVKRREIKSFELARGQAATIPDAGLIWAEIDFAPTVLRRALNFAYKAPRPTLVINEAAEYELVPELAATGFLLSPLVDSTAGFAAAMEGGPATAVRSIRWDGVESIHGRTVAVRLFELEMER